MINVMLVDDHGLMRDGLKRLLNDVDGIDVVAEAETGEQAIHQVRRRPPDVILMDISMPKMDGIEATRVISSEFPHIRIIGLSMYDRDQANRMIEAGASAYCTKGGDTDILLSEIRGRAGKKRLIK